MGILDDAIKEHLELKRQHGADASELKQLEDEAFGAAERPGDAEAAADPLAEAPTEFMQQPEVPEAEESPSGRTEIADLQEAPEPEEPAEEESPAMEHEAVPEPEAPAEPPAPSGPTTEEREAIAEQPTEMYDVEEELAASSQSEGPSEEELVEEEMDEPRLAPVDPLATEGDKAEDEEDFFDEQRLSDELDQALDAPPAETEAGEEQPAAEEPDEETEDLLEETPDFLEESEDDRLWFEQKPPKDFDFDD